ncbi:LysE type translocator superfamily protein [Marinomonas sp. MED121]|uniref:LysE family translocator n=1 Tax=Marinomonas sp. MED121 TaxID=314277 RepID=UPI0000691142|nr:LysE family translocator [Marinomonas sp. MED121]EAQ67174.1 LysE type translocator superfamily protein [Marinomonas sp. MED121]
MSLFLIWLGVMFPLVFSPGPANIVFAASGASVGVKRSIPLIAGVDTVFLVKSIIIGFGLGEVLKSQPELMNTMQLLGAFYLFYLAYKFIQSSTSKLDKKSQSLGFIDGLIVQALNSKGWLMVFLMFTLFSDQVQQEFGRQGIMLLIIWLAILNISIHFLWVSIGDLLSKISRSPTYEMVLNYLYAASLALVSAWLLIENPMLITLFNH